MARSLILTSSFKMSTSRASGYSRPITGVTSKDLYSSRLPLYKSGLDKVETLVLAVPDTIPGLDGYACCGTGVVSTSADGGAIVLS